MYSLIPHDSVQKSVALALTTVNKNCRGETPYANAFFKEMYGRSKPNKSEIIGLFGNAYTFIQIRNMLDLFLSSNGTAKTFLPLEFTHQAFPSLKLRDEARGDNHFELLSQRNDNLGVKHHNAHMTQIEQAEQGLNGLLPHQLSDWRYEYSDTLSDTELVNLMMKWYRMRGGCIYEAAYYSGLDSLALVAELSYLD